MENTTPGQRLCIVHIISGDRWAGAEVQAYTLLCELHKSHEVHALILNEGELTKRLRKKGVSVRVFDESTLSSWQIFKSLCTALKELQPQVVHTHRQKENILGSIANSITANARSVRTVHGAPEFAATGMGKLQVWLDKACGNHLQHAIIAVSDDLHQKLIPVFGKANKLHTVYNGIDPDEVRCDLHTPDFKTQKPDDVHIGIVGRLETVKRVDIFLHMAAQLITHHNHIPWQFHIFGDGKLEAELKNMSQSLNIDPQLTFHGHRSDIRSCINSLSAVVMCSDHEGLPMTALECLALGTPMLAHRVGGLAQVLTDLPNRTTKQHSPEGYAKLVLEMLDTPTSENSLPTKYCIQQTAIDTSNHYLPIAQHATRKKFVAH